jgi:ATP-binding cassette subfamily B multidrug efflux pump
VKRPRIYILDDSFSALDYTTDAKLRASLDQSASDATVLVVAQRVSTILNADQIIVLDEGKIVGIGSHRDLMNECSTYREIVLSQLSPEEAA